MMGFGVLRDFKQREINKTILSLQNMTAHRKLFIMIYCHGIFAIIIQLIISKILLESGGEVISSLTS